MQYHALRLKIPPVYQMQQPPVLEPRPALDSRIRLLLLQVLQLLHQLTWAAQLPLAEPRLQALQVFARHLLQDTAVGPHAGQSLKQQLAKLVAGSPEVVLVGLGGQPLLLSAPVGGGGGGGQEPWTYRGLLEALQGGGGKVGLLWCTCSSAPLRE